MIKPRHLFTSQPGDGLFYWHFASVLPLSVRYKQLCLLQVAEKPTKKRKRSTRSELLLRTDTIYGMLCEGRSRADILLTAAEMWEISERQTDTYIGEARKRLEKDCQMTREAFMAEALAGYRELRRAANARGQLMVSKTALDAMVQLVGLTGK